MSFRCRMISADDAAWNAALGPHAGITTHTAAYHRLSQCIWGGRGILWVVERGGDTLLWPSMQQEIPGSPGYCDLNGAYAAAGPVFDGDQAFAASAFHRLLESWRAHGVVSVFTRFSPFLENHTPVERWQASAVPAAGHIVAMDLAGGRDAMCRGMRDSTRREIVRAEARGYVLDPDQDWRRFDDFCGCYGSVLDRNAATARHRLGPAQFALFREYLGPAARLYHLLDGPRVAASALCLQDGTVLHGLFGGPHADYVQRSAYKMLICRIAGLAAATGMRYFNLGGGRGCDDADPLYIFKTGFSKLRMTFRVGRLVVDSRKYAELAAGRGDETGAFFPAYRSPAALVRAAGEKS